MLALVVSGIIAKSGALDCMNRSRPLSRQVVLDLINRIPGEARTATDSGRTIYTIDTSNKCRPHLHYFDNESEPEALCTILM
jgi:hypothetical protein